MSFHLLPGMRRGRLRKTHASAQPFARRGAGPAHGAVILCALVLSVLASGSAWAAKSWTGLGDGTTWTDGRNWSGNTAPGPADDVLLINNDFEQFGSTVTLPSGATTVTIARLTISPGPGRTITLVLPSGNTANPGLRVGDGVAGTDDIVLDPGATLVNASGASFGNGIEVQSLANGTVRINNGAHYRHATLRSASGIAPFLSAATGTETGEFEYDVPGTGASNIAASGRTYGSLTLSRSSGPGTYSALGQNPLVVRGNLVIHSGATFSSSMSGALRLAGNLVAEGSTLVVPGGQPMEFMGGSVQTITGAGVRLNGSTTIDSGATVAFGAITFDNGGTITTRGALRLDQGASPTGAGTYVYEGGTLIFNNATGSYPATAGSIWPAANGPKHVQVLGAGGITIGLPRVVPGTLLVSGLVQRADLLTVSGTLQLNAGGSLSGSPIYSGDAWLIYGSGRSVGNEWADGSSVGPGVPRHVALRTGGAPVQMPGTDRVVPGNLSIDSGTLVLDMDLGAVSVDGDYIASVAAGLVNGGLILAGGGTQHVTGPAGLNLEYLRLEKSGGSVILDSDLTITAPRGGNALEWNGTVDELRLNAHQMSLSGPIGGLDAGGRFTGDSGSSLAISGAGTSPLRFTSGTETLRDLTVDCGSAGGATLANSLTIQHTLSLLTGKVTTGANTLAIATGGFVVRTSGFVSGNLRKHAASGPASLIFEVGTGSVYSPVQLSVHSVSSAGDVTVSSVAGDHPDVVHAGLDPALTVNRYWLLSGSGGLAFDSCSVLLRFASSDVDPGADPLSFVVRRHDLSGWSVGTPGARTPTTTAASGFTALGEFVVGADQTYTIKVATVGGGSVARSPDQATYEFGTVVQLTATAAPEYHFVGWSGNASGSQNPISVLIDGNKYVTANFELNATILWTGAGDGTSWVDGNNWSSGLPPTVADQVVLDQSLVPMSYTVSLPSGGTTIQVKRLGINPASGKTITLNLPSTNTANPGLRMGDGVSGNDDLVLSAGAVLRNSSGASSGNGIEVDATGTVRINNGGRYVHNTLRSAMGIAPFLSTAPTSNGDFEYDVPGVASFPIQASSVSYGNLILTRTAGAATYTAAGGGNLQLRKDLKINAGVSLVSTMTGSLLLGGNLTNNGAALSLPTTQAVELTGTSPQTVSGTGATTMRGPVHVPASGTWIAATTVTSDGAFAVDGALQMQTGAVFGGAGTFSYHPTTGTLVFNNTGAPFAVNGTALWPGTNGPAHVKVLGSGGISLSVARSVPGTFIVAGPVQRADLLTLSGSLQLNSGGSLSGSPNYAGEATLIYGNGRAVGYEWVEGNGVGTGVPKHVTLRTGGGTVQLPATDRIVPGNLTIESGTLSLDPDLAEISVRGDFTSGVATAVVNGALNMSGSAAQHLTGPSGLTLEYLRLNKSGGFVDLLGDLTVAAPIGGNALELNGTADELRLNGHRLALGGTIGGLDASGRFRGGSGSSLAISGAGSSQLWFVAGTEVLQDLAIDCGSAGGVTLTSPLTVQGTLTLTSGAVTTGANVLSIDSGGAAERAAGRVIGNLRKHVGTDAPVSVLFEVGTASGYAGVTLAFSNLTGIGDVTATSIEGDHPDLANSGIDPAKSANRRWVLTSQGVSFGSCAVTVEFPTSDLDAGADPLSFRMRRHDASGWTAGINGSRTANSNSASGFTGLGEFAVGSLRSYPLIAAAARNDRYGIEVDFPSPAGTRIVVDGNTNPLLQNIDPEAVAGRTLIVYRDGRAALSPAMTQQPPTALENAALPASSLPAPLGSGSGQLHPAFQTVTNATFANYASGTFMPSWGDYDGDGDLDLPLYRNDGNNHFTEIPGFRSLLIDGNYHGDSWCDYDGDGDLDLVVMGYNIGTNWVRTLLLRNDGGTFVNVAAAQGMDVAGRGETPVWGDFDGDGDPDLFTPYHDHQIPDLPDSNFYYRNNGNGTFTEMSHAAGLTMAESEPPAKPEGADAVDVDGDGDLDLFTGSHLFLNNGNGVFTDVAQSVGIPVAFDEGASFVDYDNDGDFDLYVRRESAQLFRNDDGQFVDVTATSGIGTTSVLWGDSWADVDNDGDLDLVQFLRDGPARLMVNQGNGTFIVDPNFGALNLTGGMSSFGDYDHDGDLDLIQGASQYWPWSLEANQISSQPGFQGSYLNVRVLDAAGHVTQHRATVRLRSINGPVGVVQARAVGGGTTYLAQNEYDVHFGLGVRGTITRNPDLAEYELGATVQLTAAPATGYHFVSWSGDASGAQNPITVTVDAAKNVRAVFEPNAYTLSTSVTGSGSVARDPDQPTYVHGSHVELTATPSAGYHLASWTGDISGSDNPITLVMDGNKSVTANFAVNNYALTVLTSGSGTVAKSPNQPNYPSGTTVQLTATPGANYHFVGWSGGVVGTSNPINIVMDGPKTVTATFAINAYTLNVSAAGNGVVTKNPDQPTYNHGTQVQLTAQAAANHHFVSWSGDASGTQNPLTLTMDGPKNVVANFAIDTHVLNVVVVGNGTVGKSPDQPAYDHGSVVTLTATAGLGQTFLGWNGDATGTQNPLTVTMDANKTITASFTYRLDVASNGNGTVTRSPSQSGYPPGTVVTLTALPAAGYHFASWGGDTTGSQNPLSMTVYANKSVTATFALNTYPLTTTVVGDGTVTKNPDLPAYNHGSVVSVTAVAGTGSHFLAWSGAATGSQNPVSVTMDTVKTVTATFALNTVTLTVSGSGGGSVTKNPDQPTYDYGTAVTLTAVPDAGKHFVSWTGDAAGSQNPLTITMTANKSVTAVFAVNTYTLNVTTAGTGTVQKTPDQATYNHGTVVSLAATPGAGYHFVSWTGDASGSNNPLNVTMDGDKNITATFAINTYTLDVSVVGSGTVSKNPNQATYNDGTTVTLTATPGQGYRFASWSGDASGTQNPLALLMNANRSVTANFEVRPPKTWVGTTGGGDGSTWSSALNWSEGQAPAAYDSVLLDNATVTGNYTVNLPTGAVTVDVARLSILPASGRTITLILPSGNTANPGLRVGDNVAATSDIVIGAGGILRNASGAAMGNGIDVNSTANGLLRIENGGHYVHATLRSPALAARLSAASGTETGEFEYDVPNRNSFAISASGISYGSLTLTRTAGSATYTANGPSALTLRGGLLINTGITYTSTMTGAMNLAGNLVNNGAALTLPAGQAININGTALQTASGSAAITIAGAATIANGSTLAISSATFAVNGSMTVNGALQVNQGANPAGTGTYSYHATTGTLIFNTTTQVSVGNQPYWPASGAPPNVNVLGSGGINLNVSRTVTGLFQASAPVVKGNRLTLSGTNQMNAGASWPNAPVYSGSATLVYKAAATIGNEWSAGAAVGSGVPKNVIIDPGAVSADTLPAADRNVPGDLAVSSGTLAFNASAGNLLVQGNLTIDGSVAENGRLLYLNGNGVQTISGAGPVTMESLHLDKSSGSAQMLADLTCNASGANSLEFHGTNEILDLNGRTLTLSGTVGGSDANGTLKGSSTSNLALLGAGAMGTLKFTSGSRLLNNLTVNRTGAGSATLGTALDVGGTLALTSGSLITGANVLTLNPGAALTRGSGFVNGSLRKTVPTGASALVFETGTGTTYAPVDVAFGNVTTSGTLTASNFSGDHPDIANSGLDPTKTVNRYWNVTNAGTVFNNYAITLHFAATDVDAAGNVNTFRIRKYDNPTWSGITLGTRTSTSLQAVALTSFSDFAIGDIQTYTLNLTTVGNGSVAKNPDLPVYDTGTSVTLTATPSAGHSFVGWSGDASGASNPLTVVMNANKNITASFTYALNVTVVGNGTVTRSPNQSVYAPGAVVSLTATPAAGYHFVGWSGDAGGSASPLSVTMSSDKNITATFAINTYALNVTAVGNGSVAKSPNQATYDHGTVVTLTATPLAGFSFVGWSGDTSGSQNPLSVTMDGVKNITASFTLSLDVTVSGNGTVAKSPDQSTYAPGTVVTLTATPGTGYHFVGWSGDASGSTNPLTVTMNANKSITATFAINTYTLNVTPSGSGAVAKSPNQATYDHGTVVTLTATPAVGWHFLSWSGDASGSTNPLALTMDANKNVTATFAINTYTLNVATVGSGTVAKSPDQPAYDYGTVVTLTATPTAGWHFVSWSGDTAGTASPVTITMNANKNVTATFAINTYTLNVTTSGSGSVAKTPDQPAYDYGTRVTLTATPAAGWHFVSWSGDTAGTVSPVTITMNANKNVTATFAINTYTLNVTTSGSGSVTKNPDQPTYNHGTGVTLTATPITGWHFVAWGGDASGSSNPLALTMNANKNVTATFAINTYTLNVTAVGCGTIVKSPDQPTYDHGTKVTLTLTPCAGYHFNNWTGDASGGQNPISIIMDGNKNITAQCPINTYTLSLMADGDGTVAKSPDQATYNYGAVVNVTASPLAGHSFLNWTGDATGSQNPLSVTMDANKTITAHFTYALNVTVAGSGSVTRNPNQTGYLPGSSVTLTAVPAAHYHFIGWNVDTTGTQNPLTLTMTSDKNVTAMFTIDTFTLSVTTSGNGTVVRSPNQPSYDYGSTVLLTAVPATGWHFVGWSGDLTGNQSPTGLSMTADRSVTATFAINTYTLNVTAVGHGTVAKSPDQPSYDHGSVVTLTATPSPGHAFVGWSGDASGAQNPLTLTMNASKNVTASFTYALTVSVSGQGAVTKSPDQPNYAPGTVVTLTATPAPGWHLVAWTGDAAGSQNPLTLTINSDKNVTATFAINTYTLNVATTGSGAVTKSPDQPTYDHGTAVTLTATPAIGWHFVSWSGDASGAANPLTVTMDASKSVTAAFAINVYPLTVTTTGSGTVARNPDQATYAHGTSVTLTAAPAVGWHFVSWSGDASGPQNPISLTMDSARTVAATFQINDYFLDVQVVGNGSVARDPDQAVYDHGTVVTLTATPSAGYAFLGWSGDAGGTQNPLSLTMDGGKSITARFSVALTVNIVGSGTVAKNPDQPTYAPGSVVTLTASPAPGYHLVGWSGDATGTQNPLSVTMDGNKTVTATFAINKYALAVATAGSGSVVKSPDQAAYDHGTVVTLTAQPAPGWHLTGWSGDTSGTQNPIAITMTADRSVTATFAINTYTLDVNVTGSGTVAKNPDRAAYDHGTTVTLTAAPAPGWHFVSWGGAVSGTQNPITLTMDADRKVTLTFAINTYALNVGHTGNGSVTRNPDQPSYDHGQQVTLTATAGPGYSFAGWEGDASGVTNPLSVVMDRDFSVTADFVDAQPPKVKVLSPNGGELLIVGSTVTLRWEAADSAGVASVDLRLSRNGYSGPYEALSLNQSSTGSYIWQVTGPTSTRGLLRVVARDSAGNTALDQSDSTFSIGNSALDASQGPVTEFALDPVRPNPARGPATIQYAVPVEARVRVTVVDVQGRELAVLADRVHAPGRYRVTWSGRSRDGAAAAGTYFVRCRFQGRDLMRRIVVAK